jgi:hypothetical protein
MVVKPRIIQAKVDAGPFDTGLDDFAPKDESPVVFDVGRKLGDVFSGEDERNSLAWHNSVGLD